MSSTPGFMQARKDVNKSEQVKNLFTTTYISSGYTQNKTTPPSPCSMLTLQQA